MAVLLRTIEVVVLSQQGYMYTATTLRSIPSRSFPVRLAPVLLLCEIHWLTGILRILGVCCCVRGQVSANFLVNSKLDDLHYVHIYVDQSTYIVPVQ